MPARKGLPPTKEEMLAAREDKKRRYENTMRANVVLVVCEGGGKLILGGKSALRTMSILLSDVAGEERITLPRKR